MVSPLISGPERIYQTSVLIRPKSNKFSSISSSTPCTPWKGTGTLSIHTDRVTLTDVKHDAGSRLRERLRTGDELVRIHIKDTGKGIPEDVLNKLFDPFFTTKATGKGTGLGLTVSRKIAELHGGDLTLTNRKDNPGAIAMLTIKVNKV